MRDRLLLGVLLFAVLVVLCLVQLQLDRVATRLDHLDSHFQAPASEPAEVIR